VVPEGLALLHRGQGHKAMQFVDEQHSVLTGTLTLHHQVAVPQLMGGTEGVCLTNAPAQGVVAVVSGLGDAVAADLGTEQLVGCVPN